MKCRPTHILRHEHRVIEQALRALAGMCFNLTAGSRVPPEALTQALDFIQNFADRFHHTREEDCLFPALEQVGFGKEGGALSFLHEEHRIERGLLAELSLAVAEYQCGGLDAIPRFVHAANEYSKHLLGHIQKEDNLLFIIAEEVLDDDAKATLIHDLAPKHATSNKDLLQTYEHLATQLEKEWAV